MKIRTLLALQDILDKEIGWQIKEIAAIKNLVKSQKSIAEVTATRAGVPLVYAHWEGFVKSAAESYLHFIQSQRLKNSQLQPCIAALSVKKQIQLIEKSNKADVYVSALRIIRGENNKRAKFSVEGAVRTESNLNSEVFLSICTAIGVEHQPYETKSNLIDISLLKQRNQIAHGEHLDIDAERFYSLSDQVIELLRSFKTDIENNATSHAYKVAA